MQVLNKYEKEGKAIQQIASATHVSFGDIATVTRRIDGPTNDPEMVMKPLKQYFS